MTFDVMSRAAAAAALGYFNDDGGLNIRAVADLLRAPLSRWGLSPRRAVLKFARDQLRTCGVEVGDAATRTLQRLIDLGDCDEVYIGHQPHLAPTAPRWIPTEDGSAALLGGFTLPPEISLDEGEPGDIVRRVRIDGDERAAALLSAGLYESSIEEWMTPKHFLNHASRRAHKPVKSDTFSLPQFWDMLGEALFADGMVLSADADVRFLGGTPGDFFGKLAAPSPEGRWTTTPGDGVWCAYRSGYGDAHWSPCIVSVSGESRRMLDLYDRDEWCWALLARGLHHGSGEVIRADGRSTQLTFLAPRQLRAAMDLLGPPRGPWEWGVGRTAQFIHSLYE